MTLTFCFHFDKLVQTYFINIHILTLIITDYSLKVKKIKSAQFLLFLKKIS